MAVEHDSPFSAGDVVLGRYEILERLGQGAFACVFRATDRSTGRDVALKVARRPSSNSESSVLGEELRSCARISHPHVAGLIDAGRASGGQPFLVFEYVAGKTLRQILDERGALDPAVAIRWMCQILDALAAVHRQGIVHRDVKPENIMIACSGVIEHAMLLDLGLGVVGPGADSSDPHSGELAGTPRYAAPEQIRGEAATPRADLYSWALVLLECLAGSSAIRAESGREAAEEQLSIEPVPIPESLEKTPLGRLLTELTCKSADGRPDSAGVVLAMLAEVAPAVAPASGEAAQARSSRRCVTVLSARLAPPISEAETLELRTEYDAVEELCRRGGGAVVSAVGDRITAAFGLRPGDDRDAHRALDVAFALALRSSAPWSGSETPAWCIGVHTGEVEVRASSRFETAVDALPGATCAIAATLDELARPGRIVLSARTRELTRDDWVTAEIGPVQSPRLTETQQAFRIRRRRRREHGESTTSPITGRLPERRILENAWSATTKGGTHALLLIGQAGIGKSRLVREMRRIAAAADWLEFLCTVERQAVPLSGLVSLVQTLNADALTLARRHGLSADEAVPVLATLLGEPMPAGYALPAVTPERYRELVTQTVLQLLMEVASDGPTVLVAEDLHWSDPSSLDFLAALIAEIDRRLQAGSPVPLLLLTSRSEFASTWQPDGLVRIELQPMPASEVECMIHAGLPSSGAIQDEIIAQLVDASGGLPLFVEQATRLIANRLAVESEDREIPRTMDSVLAAQIDLLSHDARNVAQIAAAVGHYFDAALVGSAGSISERGLTSALEELKAAGIVSRMADHSATGYAFAHILLRDAAYRSVVEEDRPRLHGRIAAAMERDHPEIAMQRPAELALQLEMAREPKAAAELWHRSGMQALANAGYPEACDDLARGIRLLEPLPESAEKTMRILGMTTALGSAHVMMKGFSAPEARNAFQTASKLCSKAGRDVPLEVLGGLFGAALVAADREETDAVMPHFHALSHRTDSALFAFSGHQVRSVEAYWNGRIDEAWHHASISMDLYRREAVHGVSWEFGFGIHCYAYGMLSQFHRGYADEAEAIRLEMLERARLNGNPHCVAVALGWSTILLLAAGRAEETIAESNRLICLAEEQHLPLWGIYATISRAAMMAESGDAAAAVPAARHAMDMLDVMGAFVNRVAYSPYLARTLLAAGDIEGAFEAVRYGMHWCERVWTRVQEPELVRLHGVLLERVGRTKEAQEEFRRAMRIARADGNVAAQRWILASAPTLAASMTSDATCSDHP